MSERTNTRQQSIYFDNVAVTTAAFVLRGGVYGVTAKATWGGGSVTLEKLSQDGTNYVEAMEAFSEDGYATVTVPSGTYRFAVATATAVYLDMTAIASD